MGLSINCVQLVVLEITILGGGWGVVGTTIYGHPKYVYVKCIS